jgi:hypothetical protein
MGGTGMLSVAVALPIGFDLVLSDLGRHDFALEVISGLEGRESLRLRSDIYWASRNWQKAAEHIELLYGDRWKSFEPFNETERSDILRFMNVIGFTCAVSCDDCVDLHHCGTGSSSFLYF